ncbi:hypothetical protein PQQ71_40940 [Paraburkholderia dipogonis]
MVARHGNNIAGVDAVVSQVLKQEFEKELIAASFSSTQCIAAEDDGI